ncbi:tetratricopeptide repeat protein [Singulisphaera acidiphila]|uniref:tetratricopeptide repeat protein n=1 Tax=Singulisphaera acidiphila TaxID=466153 RepID=UPI000313758A|nr:tetratricopeptide repeat protein [Singulisphaera acidiphila]
MSDASEASPGEEKSENEAVVSARQRLALQKEAVGEHHPDYATGLNQLAMLLIMHGDPDGSEPMLRQALEIRKEALGERHPDFATNLSSLAGLLWARGDLDGAEPLMRQALDIRWDVLGSNHAKTKTTLNSLEQLLRAKEDWEGVDRLAAGTLSAGPPVTPVAEVVTTTPTVSASSPELIDDSAVPPAVEPMAPPQSIEPAALIDDLAVPPAAEPIDPPQPIEPVDQEPPVPPVTSFDEFATHEEACAHPGRDSSAEEVEAKQEESRPVVPRAEPGVEGTTQSRSELIGRQEVLAAQFTRVGEQLARAAEDWKSGGAPPSLALIEELDTCGRDFEQLRGEVVRLADSLGTAVAAGQLTNLDEITNHLQMLGEAEGRQAQLEAIRGQALATLDRVLSLVTADGKESASLVDCQAKARGERAAIAAAPVLKLPDDATRLAEGDHPFHALLTLVAGDGLSDDHWASSLELVEREFGKALSVSVARSRIVQP